MSECSAYLAPEGFSDELSRELAGVEEVHGRLFVCPGPAQEVAWVDNVWYDVHRLEVESITKGAGALRALQRNWALYSCAQHRRAELIQAQLPHVSARPLVFGAPLPEAPLGSWTLIAPDSMLVAARCSSPVPNGALRFVENRRDPPGRAYLKLWEVLTRLGERPGPGSLCLDLGSSPGGWTWVLQGLGARVISVDKAPLEGGIAALERVEYRARSAFALDPRELGEVDWLFCDVACYPRRLLDLLRRWLEAARCQRFVCTIKLQGRTDFEVLREFADLPDAQLRHLWHNKHELTFTSGVGPLR